MVRLHANAEQIGYTEHPESNDDLGHCRLNAELEFASNVHRGKLS